MFISTWYRHHKDDLVFGLLWALVVIAFWLLFVIAVPAVFIWLRAGNGRFVALLGLISFVVFYGGRRLFCRLTGGSPTPSRDAAPVTNEVRGI